MMSLGGSTRAERRFAYAASFGCGEPRARVRVRPMTLAMPAAPARERCRTRLHELVAALRAA